MSLIANKLSALTHLYIDHNLIEDEGADHLSTALRNNRSMQYLYLNHNKITQIGANKLATALCDNIFMKSLIIYSNSLSEGDKELIKKRCGDRIAIYNPLQ